MFLSLIEAELELEAEVDEDGGLSTIDAMLEEVEEEVEVEVRVGLTGISNDLLSSADTIPNIAEVFPVPGGP